VPWGGPRNLDLGKAYNVVASQLRLCSGAQSVALLAPVSASVCCIYVPLHRSTPHRRWFDMDENSSGKLATALNSDACCVRDAVADTVGVALQNISCLAVGYALAFVFGWRMALLVTAVLPLVVLGGTLHLKFMMVSRWGTALVFCQWWGGRG
jgi:ABC-type multidrug transport system fused ATPase/permease subunit